MHTGNIGLLDVFIEAPIGAIATGATDATWTNGRRIGPKSRSSYCAPKRQLVMKLHGRERKLGGGGTRGKTMHLRQLSGSIAADPRAAAVLTSVLVLDRSTLQIHSTASRHSS